MKDLSFNIAELMEINLSNNKNDIISNQKLLVKAVDSLHSASDLLDELGLVLEAECIEDILVKIAK